MNDTIYTIIIAILIMIFIHFLYPIVKPVDNPVVKPIDKSVVNPVVKHVVNPVVKPIVKNNDINNDKKIYDMILQYMNYNNEYLIEYCKQLGHKVKEKNKNFPNFPVNYIQAPTHKDQYGSIGEKYCTLFMRQLFPGYSFNKIRPKWLKNPNTGKNLELDIYCDELKIAVEYNGIQHYKWPNFFISNFSDFKNQYKRDRLKEYFCKKNGVYLLHVPYFIDIKKIPFYIYIKMCYSLL